MTDVLRRAALGAVAAAALGGALASWRLFAARAQVSDLLLQRSGRQSRLAEDRRAAGGRPLATPSDALDRSRAVSRLRTTLVRCAAVRGVSLDEFQAATEELPYLTAYAADANDPGWTQVPVKLTLQGRSTAVVATVAALRALDVPFEIDTLEIARRSADHTGMATVSALVGMRVLVYKGEG